MENSRIVIIILVSTQTLPYPSPSQYTGSCSPASAACPHTAGAWSPSFGGSAPGLRSASASARSPKSAPAALRCSSLGRQNYIYLFFKAYHRRKNKILLIIYQEKLISLATRILFLFCFSEISEVSSRSSSL